MAVLVYVNTSKQVGDAEHIKVFTNVDAADECSLSRNNSPLDPFRRKSLKLEFSHAPEAHATNGHACNSARTNACTNPQTVHQAPD